MLQQIYPYYIFILSVSLKKHKSNLGAYPNEFKIIDLHEFFQIFARFQNISCQKDLRIPSTKTIFYLTIKTVPQNIVARNWL